MKSLTYSTPLWAIVSVGLMLTGCEAVHSWIESSKAFQSPASSLNIPEGSDPFREAVNTAMTAAEQTQTADTLEDWQTIASLWTEAIQFMNAVPPSHPNYEVAQQRALDKYPKNLAYAQERAAEKTISTLNDGDDKLTQVDFGEGWPFTVDGELTCQLTNAGSYDIELVTLTSLGRVYAVNSSAQARATENGWLDLDEVWRDDPSGNGKAPLTWVTMRGQALCLDQ